MGICKVAIFFVTVSSGPVVDEGCFRFGRLGGCIECCGGKFRGGGIACVSVYLTVSVCGRFMENGRRMN